MKITKLIIIACITFFFIILNTYPIINGNYLNNHHTTSINTTIKGNIMLTGFWNPTGKMIKSFSTNHYLNPDGWKGENWQDLGYNIYSYFPTPGTYNGTFEVDYQNTWNDFWNITSQINPIAIISFGAGDGPWEIEYNARNLDHWINDEKVPFQPTPCPPDDTVEVDYVRHSTLPVEEIRDAVNDETNIEAWIDWEDDPGRYLCEYIAYLGMWYQNIHNSSNDQYQCKTAGFIHVKSNVQLDEAIKATELTIEKTIEYLNYENYPPDKPLKPSGETSGKTGEEYIYYSSTTDPNGDDIYYMFDYGNGLTSFWYGPYNSGIGCNASIAWFDEGNYEIRVKAQDIHGEESPWSDPLTVTMPRVKIFNQIPKIIIWLFERFPFLQPYLSQFL